MLIITNSIVIPDSDLSYTFAQSSGPGGQNVNKVATAVQLRFFLQKSETLSNDIKTRLNKLAAGKINHDGVLVILAKRYRTQEQNRADSENRLVDLIQSAIKPIAKRKPTKPSITSREKRIESKKHRSDIKRNRRIVDE